MRNTGYLLLILIVAGLVSVPSSGRADDAPIKLMGGAAAPLSVGVQVDNGIRMDFEDVTIRLKKKSYIVDAVFQFFNTGGPVWRRVGFPKRGMGYLDPSFQGADDFIRFETWVDGEKVPFEEWPERSTIRAEGRDLRSVIQGIKHDREMALFATDFGWMLKRVSFPGKAKTTTRVRYEAPYSWTTEGRNAHYVYGTGSYWKGKIGGAVFTVDGTHRGGKAPFRVTFEGRKCEEQRVSDDVRRYTIGQFEPRPSEEVVVTIELSPQDSAKRHSPK